VEKVVPKKKEPRKFKTKDRKEVVVEKKEDREAKEIRKVRVNYPLYEELVKVNTGTDMDKKNALSILMRFGWFGEWLQNYCYKYVQKKSTSRGQVPVELPEFQVIQRSQSSVELKRDAKNKVVFTIKAYSDTTFDAAKEAIETFLKVIESVDDDEE
jgi:tRNA threonylcarbamoyladenosine modification (KEOPS) complex  Pcc1 subunit